VTKEVVAADILPKLSTRTFPDLKHIYINIYIENKYKEKI